MFNVQNALLFLTLLFFFSPRRRTQQLIKCSVRSTGSTLTQSSRDWVSTAQIYNKGQDWLKTETFTSASDQSDICLIKHVDVQCNFVVVIVLLIQYVCI